MVTRLWPWLPALALAGAGCSRIPAKPPQLPPPVTRLYEHQYPIVWDTVRVDLKNDPRLELDTIDKQGQFVAWERTNNLLLLLNSRNVVTIHLEAVGAENTRMILQMSHQKYDTGGWTRPAGWYPSSNVNGELGVQIAQRLDERLRHTPSLKDQIPVTSPDDAGELPPPPAAAPLELDEPEPQRRGLRRLLPRWPWGRSEEATAPPPEATSTPEDAGP